MDLDLVEFLFSVGFVIVGSIVFHISTLISGYSIYQEMKPVESSFLSLAVGILIFIFSPIVFIILFVECVNSTVFINQILNTDVIVSFFSCAIGLGLIFGYLTTLSPRNNLLEWFRQRSGIKFWIMSYGFAWDLLLASTKKGGKISVQTKDLGEQHGKLDTYSIRKEPKQIVLDQPDGKLLILEDNIKSVRIPERSFRKHYEHMNHVGQAFNLVMVAIGFFLLSYSAINTCEYYTSTTSDFICFEHVTNYTSINVTPSTDTYISVTENLTSTSPTTHLCCKLDYPTAVNITTYNNTSNFNITIVRMTGTLDNITTFYGYAQDIFLIISIIILLLSVWIAEKDFQDWRSYLTICPEFVVMFYILALSFIYLSRDAVFDALYRASEPLQISDEAINHYLSGSHIIYSVLVSILFLGICVLLVGWLKDYIEGHWIYKESSENVRRRKMADLIAKYKINYENANDDWLSCIIKYKDKMKFPDYYELCLNRLKEQYLKNNNSEMSVYKLARSDWKDKMGKCDSSLNKIYKDIIDALKYKSKVKLIFRSVLLILLVIICGLCEQYIISLIFILILLDLSYRMVSVKPLEKVVDDIAKDVYINFLFAYLKRSDTEYDIYEMLDRIIQSIYLNLCLNIDSKSSIKDVCSDSLNIFDKFVDYFIGKIIIDCLMKNTEELKKNHKYMRREDVNILLIFRRILKERMSACQSKILMSKTLNTDKGNLYSMPDYASIIISNSLKVQPSEEVVIFADKKNLKYSDDLADRVRESAAQVSIFYIPETIRPLEKITDIHSTALISADAVIYVLETTDKKLDLSKEVAFRHYLFSLPIQYKGRVCMMPGFSDEMKEAAMIDYSELNRKCRNLKQIISDKNIRIKTDLGTDVKFSIYQRKVEIDDGDLSKPGLFGNIPAGEIFTAPVEDTINGKLVIDGSIGGIGQVKTPFIIELEAGKIKHMEPIGEKDEIFDKFSEICEYDAPATKTVGEFGIGLNPGAKIIGNMLMDEKVEGTIHFAFGDSYGLGKSSSKYHTDLLIRSPSIFVEDKCIMDKGIFVVDI